LEFKRIEGELSPEQNLKAVNQDYPQPEHICNCGSCTVAYELRRQGYDVEALPSVTMYIEELAEMFDGAAVKNASEVSMSLDPLEMASIVELDIQKWGEGARGAITGRWVDHYPEGHLFSFEVRNGATVFDDAQSGEMCVKHLEGMVPQTIQYVRLDNTKPNDKALTVVKNRRK